MTNFDEEEEAKTVDFNNDDDNNGSSIWVFEKTKCIYEDYVIGNFINKGASSEVYNCTKKINGESYAVKIMNKNCLFKLSKKNRAAYIKNLKNEVEILQIVRGHKHIVNLQEIYEDENSLYLVLENCKGGELHDYIINYGVLSENQAKIVMSQIFSAVQDLHEKYHVCHSDLKLSNILLVHSRKDGNISTSSENDDEYNLQIKIIDFGFSKKLKPYQYIRSSSGTIHFTAPEIFAYGTHDHAADCWSLGVILFVILYGFLPFVINPIYCNSEAEEQMLISNLILKGFNPIVKHGYGPWFSSNQNVSKIARNLIAKLLCSDFRIRCSAKIALKHAWFQQQQQE